MESRGGVETLKFIHEDNHLLVADKPSGLPSQPDASGDPALDDLARDYLRRRYNKPGNVYLALLHRLDRPTSGVVLMARTDKAASRMAEAFRRRMVEKTYLALVACHARPRPEASLATPLAADGRGGMRVAESAPRGEKIRQAMLRYRLLGESGDGGIALLEVNLETGVKHQIRCQLAWEGLPVVGDFRYGPRGAPARPEPVAGGRAVLLHAWRAAFDHPVGGKRMVVTAPPPLHWQNFLARIPGDAAASLKERRGP